MKKQTIKNCPPVSLFPICEKIFERITFNNMSEYFAEHNLISQNIAGFGPVDSINQLLSIIMKS